MFTHSIILTAETGLKDDHAFRIVGRLLTLTLTLRHSPKEFFFSFSLLFIIFQFVYFCRM